MKDENESNLEMFPSNASKESPHLTDNKSNCSTADADVSCLHITKIARLSLQLPLGKAPKKKRFF